MSSKVLTMNFNYFCNRNCLKYGTIKKQCCSVGKVLFTFLMEATRKGLIVPVKDHWRRASSIRNNSIFIQSIKLRLQKYGDYGIDTHNYVDFLNDITTMTSTINVPRYSKLIFPFPQRCNSIFLYANTFCDCVLYIS